VQYVAGRIAESFKIGLFVIWSEDHSEKLVICHVLGSSDKDDDGVNLCLLLLLDSAVLNAKLTSQNAGKSGIFFPTLFSHSPETQLR